MSIVHGLRSVWQGMAPAKSRLNLLAIGKLSGRNVLNLALNADLSVRKQAWQILNDKPGLIIDLLGKDPSGKGSFTSEIERISRCSEAAPKTIAFVLSKVIREPFDRNDILRAASTVKSHRIREQGDILVELARIDRGLYLDISHNMRP